MPEVWLLFPVEHSLLSTIRNDPWTTHTSKCVKKNYQNVVGVGKNEVILLSWHSETENVFKSLFYYMKER